MLYKIRDYFFSHFFTFFSALLVMYVLINELSIREFGIYSFLLSILSILIIASDSGIKNYTINQIQNNEFTLEDIVKKVISNQIYLIFLLVLAYLILAMTYKLLGIKTLIFGVSFLLLPIFNPLAGYLQAKQKTNLILVRDFLAGAGQIIGILLIWKYKIFSLIYFLPLLKLITLTIFYRLAIDIKFKFFFNKFSDIAIFFKKLSPFIFLSVMTVLYNRIDIFFIEYFGNYTDVGLFNSVTRITWPSLIISNAILFYFYPIFSGHALQAVKKEFLLSLKLSFFGGVFVFIILNLFAGIYASIFNLPQEVISYIFISSTSIFLIYIYSSLTIYLTANNAIKALLKIYLIAFIINCLLNTILVPLYGITGALVATLFSEIILLAIICIYFRYNT